MVAPNTSLLPIPPVQPLLPVLPPAVLPLSPLQPLLPVLPIFFKTSGGRSGLRSESGFRQLPV
jgi:hypothetical protein